MEEATHYVYLYKYVLLYNSFNLITLISVIIPISFDYFFIIFTLLSKNNSYIHNATLPTNINTFNNI